MRNQRSSNLSAATAISSLSLLSPGHRGAWAIETNVSFALVMRGLEPVTGPAKCTLCQNGKLVTGDPNVRLQSILKDSAMAGALSLNCTPLMFLCFRSIFH